jgi:alkanesulfonate monooxygenase SsuD/methylene tetrahydromethanopterin reductase-like flavin-dependent oxidoreductase (luciferase family)
LLIAAAVARETTTISVGTCIALAPLYHPVRLAEDAALVDILSSGRLILGVGAGYAPDDLGAFGVASGELGKLFEDCVGFLRQAWTKDEVTFTGAYHHFDKVSVSPKPIQKPSPQIWCAGWSVAGLRRAGRFGDRWIVDGLNTLATAACLYPHYRTAAEVHGKVPKVAVLRECWVAATTAEAIEQFADHVMTSHRFYFDAGGYRAQFDPSITSLNSAQELTFERAAADRFIVGSPTKCIDEINRWHDQLGADYFVMRFRHPSGPSHAAVKRAVQRFGESVIPHFS